MKKNLIFLYLSLTLLAFIEKSAVCQTTANPPDNLINENTIRAKLSFLSSAWFEGRKTGEKGNEMAANYLISVFGETGLEPLEWKDNSPVSPGYSNGLTLTSQNVPLLKVNATPPEPVQVITNSGSFRETTEFVSGNDFTFYLKPPFHQAHLNLPVVLAGYGLTDSVSGYNDFKNTDVKGKAVVILTGFPGFNDTLSPAYQQIGKNLNPDQLFGVKLNSIEKAGASAVLFCNISSEWAKYAVFDNNAFALEQDYTKRYPKFILAGDSVNQDAPVLIISPAMFHHLLQGSGIDIEKYQTDFAKTSKPNPLLIRNKEIEFNLKTDRKFFVSQNILGVIPGKKSDEFVVVGAHYDHIGKKNDEIFYGADDNASGVAAVIAIAEACKAMNTKPEKTILFALWTGEEERMLGSEYFVKKWNQGKIDAYYNFDMVGRYNSRDSANFLTIFHSPGFSSVRQQIADINLADNLNLRILFNDHEKEFDGSDQQSFADKHIPYCWFSTGFHPDYHKTTDKSYKIKMKDLTRITNLGFRAVWEQANH